MFYLGGVSLAFFLSLLLLSKSRKTLADKILSVWLFIMTVHLLLFYFYKREIYNQFLGAELPLPLVHGPLLYLYTKALTDRPLSLKVSLIHFLVPLGVLVYLIPFLALPTEQKVIVYQNKGVGYEMFNRIKLILIMGSGVVYVVLSSAALRNHRRAIAEQFSSTEKINLKWLQYLIYWIGVIWIFVILRNDEWIFTTTVFFIFFIGYFGIRQTGIFNAEENTSPSMPLMESDVQQEEIKGESESSRKWSDRRKYQKSGLDMESSESLHNNLLQSMNNDKLFRNSELSLTELARHLNTQPNYLSQVINEREGKNFYDFINTLRIAEFQRLAASPESRKYTLLALAQECGFNSKSSFNRYFKKVTGQLPSEFMQSVSDSRN